MSRYGSSDPYINRLIFSRYLIQKRVGKGSFGTVYQGIIKDSNEKVAVKIEKREKNDTGTLETEAYRLIYLQGEGIPKIFCYGNNQSHNLLVEELLGRSLEDLFNSCNKKFSLKTVCVLGIEMIKRIQFVHSKYHLHRDIKPDNFMTGRGANEDKIYIIDFGLAKKYYSTSKHQHIKFCEGKHLIGTARYCGRNAHRGYEQGRRDDIESIGYVLMYFLVGMLPWQGLKLKRQEDQFEKIAQKKYNTSFEELTEGQPEEFLKYFKHCDELQFEEQPDYEYLISLFQSMIDKYCDDCFYDFDWQKKFCRTFSHLSCNQEMNKSRDVSLLVNNNNNVSALECSKYEEDEEEEEEDDDDEQNKIETKRIKNKIFIKNEDDGNFQENDFEENNNENEDNGENEINDNEGQESGRFGVQSKKNTHSRRSKSVIDVKLNSDEMDYYNNKVKNKNDNENKNNVNNNINNLSSTKGSSKMINKKGTIKKEKNEYGDSTEFDKQKSWKYNNNINVIRKNENSEEKMEKQKNSNNNYNYNNCNNSKQSEDTKDYNNETHQPDDSINESSYRSEEGTKKEKRNRNRNRSMDDNIRYRKQDEYCKCKQCIIF